MEIVCQVVFPNLVWKVTSGDRWIMALEATKLASTSNTDMGDMSGPGEGRAAPGLPNSGFQKYWDSKICFVQFTFDTESTGLIIDRPVWEPRKLASTTWNMNWPLGLFGSEWSWSAFSPYFCGCSPVYTPPRSRHLSLSKQQGVTSASQLPWEWMKTKFTVKAKNFHGSIFQHWHFSFFSIKELDNSIRWRCLWWNMINEARLTG